MNQNPGKPFPPYPLSLVQALELRARLEPERPAYCFLGEDGAEEWITYGELDARARGIARFLRQEGFAQQRALLLYPPSLDFIAAFLGCLYAGAVAVPAYPPGSRRTLPRLRAIIDDAQPAVALTTAVLGDKFSTLAGRLPELGDLPWQATDALLPLADDGLEQAPPEPKDLAFLQYTSGSTADPKGVMVRHGNLSHNEEMIRQAFELSSKDVIVGWLPLYHDMGLIGNVLQPLYVGARCVLMAPVTFLRQPRRWLEAISQYRGTTSGGPNFAFDLCVRKIPPEERQGLDLSCWRVAFNGAEPVRAETLERFAEAFSGAGFSPQAFYPCYGLAEGTLLVTGGSAKKAPRVAGFDAELLAEGRGTEAPEGRRLVGNGGPWAEQELAIVDPYTGIRAPGGTVGEIWVSGGSVAGGYWGRPAETARDFDARLEGFTTPFLRTGDLGFLHHGELFVTGRLKDLIILRGRNLYPQDVELTVERSHPDLRPGCGAAFSVEMDGEERLVVVQEWVRRPSGALPEEVLAAAREAVALEHEARLQELVLIRWGSIPKTSSGKIQRRACRGLYLRGELEGNAAGPATAEDSPPSLREVSDLVFRDRAAVLELPPEQRPTALEVSVLVLVAKLLELSPRELAPARPLASHGLDSLGAVELQQALAQAFGVQVALSDLLDGATAQDLAERLQEGLADDGTAPQEVAEEGAESLGPRDLAAAEDLPLTPGQEALWFLQRLAPESSAYHITAAADIFGPLQLPAFRRAFEALVERHEALRATFHAPRGEPVQRFTGSRGPEFIVEAGETLDEAEVTQFLRREALRLFDLERGPLLRVVVVRRGEDRHAMALAVHHLVADFWSLSVLVKELEALYRQQIGGGAAALAPLPVGYGDFVLWNQRRLQGSALERSRDYWQQALAGPLPDLELPTDRPRPPVQTDRGGSCGAHLGAEASAAVSVLAEASGATPFAVLAASLLVLLHRLSGQGRVTLGTPFAGRPDAALAPLVGYFVNPVVLLSEANPAQSFAAYLASCQTKVVAALEHADLPFPLLAERLRPVRDPSRSPLFQVFLTLHKAHRSVPASVGAFGLGQGDASLDLAGLNLQSRPLDDRPVQFDLSFAAAQTMAGSPARPALGVTLQYNRDLYDGVTAERLLERWFVLLAGAASQPGRLLAELPVLRPAERRQILEEVVATATEIPETILPGLFEDQAQAHPERLALVFQGEEWTYGQLEARSNQLARYLLRLGVEPETPVGVVTERSATAVAALLGVMKAGASYVPLDPAYPADRISFMLADSGAPFVLADVASRPAVAAFPGRTILLDGAGEDADPWREESGQRPPCRIGPDNRAYVIYTSGSTGRPKGVQIPHRPLVNFLRSMAKRPGLLADDVLVAVTTLSFDIAGLELFLPLTVGARVVVADRATAADGSALLALLGQVGATALQATPATWRLLLAAGWLGEPRIKVLCGGEALPGELAEELVRRGRSVWNLYGPTETTIWSAVQAVDGGPDADGSARSAHAAVAVSIGRPIDNTSIYILDAAARLVPPGVAGELLIGGAGLARGYLNRPALTADRFVPDPFAGVPGARLYRTGDLARLGRGSCFEYLGRLDHQVKVRGHRIELGEIEAALVAHPSIIQAVVAARQMGAGDHRLVAYIVAGEAAPGIEELRRFLAETLPEAFLPAAVVSLDRFPLTPNGKVDRRALPEPTAARPDLEVGYRAPRSPLERRIAELWAEVLGLEAVGLEDNFFDLGGHSLLLAKVHSRLEAELGDRLSMVDLFRYPTVRALAEHLGAAGDGSAVLSAPPPDGPREQRESRDIAVIGLAGRFPGARSAAELWQKLRRGEELLSFFTEEELLAEGFSQDLLRRPDYVRASGYLEGADHFDAGFFAIPPREAEMMDPQHRLFLECSWEGLEDAGYDPARSGGRVGVFAGVGLQTYGQEAGLGDIPSGAARYQAFLGNDKDFVPTRVSYKLDLKGPSLNVQTACSSSLVAVHLAIQSLLAGECEMALVGGCTVRTPLKAGYLFEEGGIPSPDGHCRPFDADAAGTVFGNGAAVVVLKPLHRAVADGDPIRAVIKGSAINNDGAGKIGYTAPSVEGQAEVIAAALRAARVPADSITYVEAHGTATPMGDPIEVAALKAALGGPSATATPCALGSIKSNVGHLDTAAGVAGLIKTVLSLEHGEIPASLHFVQPNPQLGLDGGRFFVNAELRSWTPAAGLPRRAGVSSFGIGGTNAHVVLEEAPPQAEAVPSRPHQLLLLSARSEAALQRSAEGLKAAFEEEPVLADVAFTLSQGRRAFAHRMAVVGHTGAEAAEALSGQSGDRVSHGRAPEEGIAVAFLCSGQGSQYPGMGQELYQTEPVYRAAVDRCCELLLPWLGRDLRTWLLPETEAGPQNEAGDAQRLDQTAFAQPALFVVEYALVQLWAAWGITPAAMLGHSIGEYVAAWQAGVFELPAVLRLVAARGRLMQGLPAGSMLAVELAEEKLTPLLGEGSSVAAVNGPQDCVASGPEAEIRALEETLNQEGVKVRRLRTSHAFHSAMMEPILDAFRQEVVRAAPKAPQRPFVSNVTGTWIEPQEAVDADYWVRHLRGTVRFAAGVECLLERPDTLLLEVGPGQSLASLARKVGAPVVAGSLRHPRQPESDSAFLLRTLGRLWVAGAEVDWDGFWSQQQRRRVSLPSYPFERQRYWLERRPRNQRLEERRPDPADWLSTPLWREAPPLSSGPAVAGPRKETETETEHWLLFADDAGVVRRMVEALGSSGGERRWTVVEAGDGFADLGEDGLTVRPGVEEDFLALIEHLAERDRLPSVIVHGWGVTEEQALPDAESLYRELPRSRAVGSESLIALARCLERVGSTRPARWTVLVNELFSVSAEAPRRPDKALALGPLRVLSLEYPQHRCRCLSLNLKELEGEAGRRLIRQLLAETAAPITADERIIALAGGRRWLQEEGPLAVEAGASPPRLREGGVYLITGGLGDLGLAIADHLAAAVRPRLVLVGRRPLPPRDRWQALRQDSAPDPAADPASRALVDRLLTLEEKGAQVLALTADVTDRQALGAALLRAEEAFGPLHGVIHAAGVAGGAMLQGRDPQQARAVMAPKVEGTLVLASLLGRRPLDFLVLFSSVTGTLGGFGQTDYCAANAFLDAFATSALAPAGAYTVAVGWDRWEEIGMAERSQPGGAVAPGRGIATGHPLLGERLEESQERRIFSADFSPEQQWVLSEHQIAGRPTVPGTTFLEMARAAFAQRHPGPVEISGVVFLAPLAVSPGEQRQVLTVLQGAAGEQAFRIFSRAREQQEDEWSEHARGKIAAATSEPGPDADLQALEAACGERTIEVGDRVLGAHGTFLRTGPRWHSLRRMIAAGSSSLAEVELAAPFAADGDSLHLHPALLDVAAGAVQFLAEGNFLPFSYERLTLRRPLPRRFFSHFVLREGKATEALTCDLRLLAPDGAEVAVVEGFSMRRVRDDVAAQLAAGGQAAGTPVRGVLEGRSLPLPTPAGEGIAPQDGVQLLRRILDAGTASRILVTPRPLSAVRRSTDALNRSRLEADLAAAATRPRHDRPQVSSDFVAPEDDLERRIAAIWQKVLGLDRVGVHDNFFELGGSSLNGVQLVAELKEGLGIEIPTVSIFEAPTVSALARYLEARDSKAEKFTAARRRAEQKQKALGQRRGAARRRRP